MQVYSSIIKVSKNDLDELNHVNNVRYIQWVQDIAKTHWQRNATPEILQNYFWVLTSHHIEYKSPALLDDEIRLETYVSKSEGLRSTRIVEMYNNETNKSVAKSETNWCLMDYKTMRPIRITSEIIALFE